jgi:two-component system OmpR family sensor kinase
MGGMKSLRQKTLWQFLLCTAGIMLLATPVFYLLTKHFYAEDIIDVLESMRSGTPVPPLDLEQDIMIGVMLQYALIFIVLSVSFLLMMQMIARKTWSPFYDTLHKLEHYNIEQDESLKFAPVKIKEFAQLNEVASKLISKDKESFVAQKHFIENASHEMQTPIAVLKGKLDLLLQEELTEKQSQLVSEMYSVTGRLSRLDKNLLLLAKIDNKQYERKEIIDVYKFIEERMAMFADIKNDRDINLVKIGAGDCEVKANSILLESLINNLVVNAIRHSKKDGTINVFVGNNEASVTNEAINGKLDEENLFKRFVNNQDESRGNGLGLAIAKAVCDYHGWKIKYTFNNSLHSFSVIFG